LTATRDEVGEDSIITGAGEVEGDAPGSGLVEYWMHMLECGHIAADHDEVQILVVAADVAGDGCAVAIQDAKPQRKIRRRSGLRGVQAQGVAVFAGHESRG